MAGRLVQFLHGVPRVGIEFSPPASSAPSSGGNRTDPALHAPSHASHAWTAASAVEHAWPLERVTWTTSAPTDLAACVNGGARPLASYLTGVGSYAVLALAIGLCAVFVIAFAVCVAYCARYAALPRFKTRDGGGGGVVGRGGRGRGSRSASVSVWMGLIGATPQGSGWGPEGDSGVQGEGRGYEEEEEAEGEEEGEEDDGVGADAMERHLLDGGWDEEEEEGEVEEITRGEVDRLLWTKDGGAAGEMGSPSPLAGRRIGGGMWGGGGGADRMTMEDGRSGWKASTLPAWQSGGPKPLGAAATSILPSSTAMHTALAPVVPVEVGGGVEGDDVVGESGLGHDVDVTWGGQGDAHPHALVKQQGVDAGGLPLPHAPDAEWLGLPPPSAPLAHHAWDGVTPATAPPLPTGSDTDHVFMDGLLSDVLTSSDARAPDARGVAEVVGVPSAGVARAPAVPPTPPATLGHASPLLTRHGGRLHPATAPLLGPSRAPFQSLGQPAQPLALPAGGVREGVMVGHGARLAGIPPQGVDVASLSSFGGRFPVHRDAASAMKRRHRLPCCGCCLCWGVPLLACGVGGRCMPAARLRRVRRGQGQAGWTHAASGGDTVVPAWMDSSSAVGSHVSYAMPVRGGGGSGAPGGDHQPTPAGAGVVLTMASGVGGSSSKWSGGAHGEVPLGPPRCYRVCCTNLRIRVTLLTVAACALLGYAIFAVVMLRVAWRTHIATNVDALMAMADKLQPAADNTLDAMRNLPGQLYDLLFHLEAAAVPANVTALGQQLQGAVHNHSNLACTAARDLPLLAGNVTALQHHSTAAWVGMVGTIAAFSSTIVWAVLACVTTARCSWRHKCARTTFGWTAGCGFLVLFVTYVLTAVAIAPLLVVGDVCTQPGVVVGAALANGSWVWSTWDDPPRAARPSHTAMGQVIPRWGVGGGVDAGWGGDGVDDDPGDTWCAQVPFPPFPWATWCEGQDVGATGGWHGGDGAGGASPCASYGDQLVYATWATAVGWSPPAGMGGGIVPVGPSLQADFGVAAVAATGDLAKLQALRAAVAWCNMTAPSKLVIDEGMDAVQGSLQRVTAGAAQVSSTVGAAALSPLWSSMVSGLCEDAPIHLVTLAAALVAASILLTALMCHLALYVALVPGVGCCLRWCCTWAVDPARVRRRLLVLAAREQDAPYVPSKTRARWRRQATRLARLEVVLRPHLRVDWLDTVMGQGARCTCIRRLDADVDDKEVVWPDTTGGRGDAEHLVVASHRPLGAMALVPDGTHLLGSVNAGQGGNKGGPRSRSVGGVLGWITGEQEAPPFQWRVLSLDWWASRGSRRGGGGGGGRVADATRYMPLLHDDGLRHHRDLPREGSGYDDEGDGLGTDVTHLTRLRHHSVVSGSSGGGGAGVLAHPSTPTGVTPTRPFHHSGGGGSGGNSVVSRTRPARPTPTAVRRGMSHAGGSAHRLVSKVTGKEGEGGGWPSPRGMDEHDGDTCQHPASTIVSGASGAVDENPSPGTGSVCAPSTAPINPGPMAAGGW